VEELVSLLHYVNNVTSVFLCSHKRYHTFHRAHQRYKNQPSAKRKAGSPAIATAFTKKQFALFARKKMSKEAADILISRLLQLYTVVYIYNICMYACIYVCTYVHVYICTYSSSSRSILVTKS